MKKILATLTSILTIVSNSVFALDANLETSDVKNLRLLNASNTFLEVEFDAAENAVEYLLFLSEESVDSPEKKYTIGPIKSTETQIKAENLEPSTNYFMAVVARFEDGFSRNFSNQLKASTLANEAVVEVSPFIENSSTPTIKTIELNFNQEMDFSSLKNESFRVELEFDSSLLSVINSKAIDSKTVRLEILEELSAGSEYKITVNTDFLSQNGKSIEDKDKTTIVVASLDIKKELETGLKVTEFVVLPNGAIELIFNENLKENQDLKSQIIILEVLNPDNILEIQDVIANNTDKNKVLVVPKNPEEKEYSVVLLDLISESDKIISDEDSQVTIKIENLVNSDSNTIDTSTTATTDASTENTDTTTNTSDTTESNSPSDVSQLKATATDAKSTSAKISYKKATDADGDLKGHNIYLKSSDSDFELKDTVGKDTEQTNLNLDGVSALQGTVKVTAFDEEGNESEGKTTPIRIPSVGPFGFLWLAFGALSFSHLYKKEDSLV